MRTGAVKLQNDKKKKEKKKSVIHLIRTLYTKSYIFSDKQVKIKVVI